MKRLMRYVYLHGFASSPDSRKAQAFRSALARESVELEIPQLDEGDFARLTLTGQLNVIENTLHGEPASLIGSSMGGYLAALYAAQHPEVSRLVLLAPAFGFAPRWREMTGEKAIRDWEQSGWRDVYHYGEQRMRPIHYGLLEDALQYPAHPDFTQPALIFHGTGDTVVPVDLAQAFARTHTNATLTELHSDHELTDVLEVIISRAIPFLVAR